VTQSSLSKRVQEIGEAIAVELFERSTASSSEFRHASRGRSVRAR
jgi:DNA-binding transcriptional LysR family regulator